MSDSTITGRITYKLAPGGPDVNLQLGSPVTNPTSATGPQLTYEEKVEGTLVVPATTSRTVNFESLSSADILYVGTDRACSVVLNGGTDIFHLKDGGYIHIYKAGITGMVITAGVNNAKIQYLLLGDLP